MGDSQQLSVAIDSLTKSVDKLTERVEKIEDVMTKGKGFVAGVFAVLFLAALGILGAFKQIKEFVT